MGKLTPLMVALALVAPAGAWAMEMEMGSPEHVEEALAALKAHKNAAAKKHLKEAIATKAEPKCARDHAKEALEALNAGKRSMAIDHATNGAACEHLTLALSALQAGKTAEGRHHLMEAAELKPYKRLAEKALIELKAGHRATAIALTRKALAQAAAAD
jgi:hypothetical protein